MQALVYGLLLLCATGTGGRNHPDDRLLAVQRLADYEGGASPCDVQLVVC